MIRCTCGAELFSTESICSVCLPQKQPRALFVEDLRIKLANREEELLDWKETAELANTENVELRAERDRLAGEVGRYKAMLKDFSATFTARGTDLIDTSSAMNQMEKHAAAAEAERDRLKAAGFKILAKLDHILDVVLLFAFLMGILVFLLEAG